MASRTRGRQFAVQLIYQADFSGKELEDLLAGFWDQQECPIRNREFPERLAAGVLEHREELDLELAGYLEKWSLDRLISLNRIILEMGLFELKYLENETPWKVAVDEAVLMTRMFAGEEHISFVNGVLHNWCVKNRGKN